MYAGRIKFLSAGGHRNTGQFFSGGSEPSVPKKYFDNARKTCYANPKIAFPDSPRPLILSTNPTFRALHLAGRNEFCVFCLVNIKRYFFIFGCWLLFKKFSV